MRECLVEEVADLELDVGVVAVAGLDDREHLGAVGQRRVVASVREQLGLGAGQANAAHDQALTPEGRLGDLRLAALRVVLKDAPCLLVDQVDRGGDRRAQAHADRVQHPLGGEPRAQRRVVKPRVGAQQDLPRRAIARRTRAISSSAKRMIPRWVLAFPMRNRTCRTSPDPARVAISG